MRRRSRIGAGSLLPEPVHRYSSRGPGLRSPFAVDGGPGVHRPMGGLHTDLVEAMSLPEWPVRTGREA